MANIIILKQKVSGEFEGNTNISIGNKKTNQIEIKIGGGVFSKPDGEYSIPRDLLSYTYEAIEKEEESLTKNLIKLGSIAAGAATAVGAAQVDNRGGDKGGTKMALGATAGLLGAAGLRMDTKSKNIYILVNLQFNDKKILSLEMKDKEWRKFDEDYSVITFPEFELETQRQKEAVNNQIEAIREQYSTLGPSEQTEANNILKTLSPQVKALDSILDQRKKLAIKRKVPLQLESS